MKFTTLKPGDKFHDIIDGQPVPFIRVASDVSYLCDAVNLLDGSLYAFDEGDYVFPTDAGWIAEIECYGKLPDDVKAKGCRAIISHVFERSEARKATWEWHEEIAKYYPALNVMSFIGPKRVIPWLMEQVKKNPPK